MLPNLLVVVVEYIGEGMWCTVIMTIFSVYDPYPYLLYSTVVLLPTAAFCLFYYTNTLKL